MQCYLGLFLLNNYRQAIKNIQELEPKLNVMKENSASRTTRLSNIGVRKKSRI